MKYVLCMFAPHVHGIDAPHSNLVCSYSPEPYQLRPKASKVGSNGMSQLWPGSAKYVANSGLL